MKDEFIRVYEEKRWCSNHPSGPGSTHDATKEDAHAIRRIIEEYGIRTVIDAPCGYYSWMKSHGVTEGLRRYWGFDIVPALVERNNKESGDSVHSFSELDIVNESQQIAKWDADLIICRECTQHLTDESTSWVLSNLMASKCRYLLITNYPTLKTNRSTPTWGEKLNSHGYRQQNLDLPPYNLSSIVTRIGHYWTFDHWEPDKYQPRYLTLYKL